MSSPGVAISKAVLGMASALSTALATLGAWVIAQASPISDLTEIIGGGAILAAGVVSLRMVLRASKHERESSQAIEDNLTKQLERAIQDSARAEARLEEAHLELDKERARSARLIMAFDRERNLRLGLEAHGIDERRGPEDDRELIKLTDIEDLREEIGKELRDESHRDQPPTS